MKPIRRLVTCLIVVSVLHPLFGATPIDTHEQLLARDIVSVRINLLPGGASLGFELEVPGDDPRVAALVRVLRDAGPGKGHRCSNAGAIRFRMSGGDVVGIGLLPGHEEGVYEFRLYDGERFVGVYRPDRDALLAALDVLGVPMDDRAFRD